jgi:uroporphyrinogen III methyltransferase/synthase
MIERARRGFRVARFKGACPTLLGRLAEEVHALRAAAVPFEIVPGVSSALAVPAYAGIPLTANSIAILTSSSFPRARPQPTRWWF